MSSTIETLERDLGEAQSDRENEQRAVIRAENAHEAACSERDEAWSESYATDPEIERLSSLVYQRRRELYEAIDRLKGAEGRERRIKSRLMYVLPAERRRYLLGTVDENFEALISAVQRAYEDEIPGLQILVITENPGELDLRGDATWRALERLYSGITRRWVEIRVDQYSLSVEKAGRQISYYAGGHVPRLFVGGEESRFNPGLFRDPESWNTLSGYETPEGRAMLAKITVHRYLDEIAIERLGKQLSNLIQIAEIARLYQTLNLTGDEIRWRLEQLVSLRLEVLKVVYDLTKKRRRFSFYEIARAARLLDSHFPDPGVAAESLTDVVDRALESGVPLVDAAYITVTGKEDF